MYLTDSANHLFHARSFNVSTMAIRTGSASVSCEFSIMGIPNGSYNLFVSANGISSASGVPFTVASTGAPLYA